MSLVEGLQFLAQDTTVQTMTAIFTTLIVVTLGTGQVLCTKTPNAEDHCWLPNRNTHELRRHYEVWALGYGVVWMAVRRYAVLSP